MIYITYHCGMETGIKLYFEPVIMLLQTFLKRAGNKLTIYGRVEHTYYELKYCSNPMATPWSNIILNMV